MKTLRISNGRVIDPSQQLDEITDVWIRGDRIHELGPQANMRADEEIDASGKIVCSGLIDMHVHLREPGSEEDETIKSGTRAALAGGFTSVACMPNTSPAIDSQAAAEFIYLQAERAKHTNVFPIGAVTKDRRGEELAEIGGLVQGGAKAFTDHDAPIASAEIMRRALEYCRMFETPVLSHAEDRDLTRKGVMNEGFESMRLGLPGMPNAAEEVIIFRDLELARLTGGLLHVLHVTTAEGVDLIRWGKRKGIRVTAEACPHHFTLTDEKMRTFDNNCKMAPPLRTQEDRDAVLAGLKDGTIDVITSDHSPLAPEKTILEVDLAPFGVIGLETLLPVCIKSLIEPGVLTWPELIAKLTINPARILHIHRGTLKKGSKADVTIIDPEVEWTINVQQFNSKARNSPFDGLPVRGRSEMVLVNGEVKFTR